MRLVVLESPYSGDVEANLIYAHECIKDCFSRGEAPFASHVLYTSALNDFDKKERAVGMHAGFEWGEAADATVVYTDNGISRGMQEGINQAVLVGRPVEYRRLKPSLNEALEHGA